MKIVKFAVKNALMMNLLTVMILGAGIYEMTKIRREAFPEIEIDYVWITTIYPGAGPKEVERYISDSIEREIKDIDGIKKIDSSSIEGLSKITIELDPDRSEFQKDRTVTDIQRSVDQVPDLPVLPDPPRVRRLSSAKSPIIDVALGGDMDFASLHTIGEKYRDRLETLPDVAEMVWRSERKPEFWVEVDPDKMSRLQVSFAQIQRALDAQNINLPGGSLKVAEGELLLRSVGQLTGVDDIQDVIVASNGAGNDIRIRDIATVSSSFSKETIHLRANASPVIQFSAMINTTKGDIIRATEKIKAESDQFVRDINQPGLEITYINDVSVFVDERLSVLMSNGGYGILLVLAVLLLFLSKGIAFITALGMPVALLGAILVMSYSGMTINLITMFAMILVIGMLVDDAIIVAENIWQHYEKGDSAWDATIKGASEVFWPVTATIMTTVAAFSPMLMVSGIFGQFIRWLPITVIVMLAISLLEAMFILPSHAYDVLKFTDRRKAKRLANGKSIKIHKGEKDSRLLDSYVWVLGGVLKLRYLFLAGIIGLFFVSSWWAKNKMNMELFPDDQMTAFFVRGKLPINTTMAQTTEKFKHVEAMIREIPAGELKDYVTYVGLIQNDPGDPFAENGGNIGQIAVYLTPALDRQRDATEILEEVRGKFDTLAPSLGFTEWNLDMVRSGPPVGKPIAVQVKGEDYGHLLRLANEIADQIEAIDGTDDITIDYAAGKDEVQIDIDHIAAARALLTPSDISAQILAAHEGVIATYIREAGDRTPVRVKFIEQNVAEVESLRTFALANARGNIIPLADVATFSVQPGVRQLLHRDTYRTVGITANIDTEKIDSTTVNKQLEPYIENMMSDNSGVLIELGGEYEETTRSMESLGKAFAVALALIFLILAAQFQSVSQPLVVMAAIPFGVIGMIWAFYFHSLPISFVGLIGMIGLSGVIVNDSIVLIDFVNKARSRGMSAKDACLYAGRRRFRAVWLTTATTVMGLFPLVYGLSGMDRFVQPAAVTMGYGLVFGTVLILFLVPALYIIRIDIGNMLRWIVYLGKPPEDSPPRHLDIADSETTPIPLPKSA